MANTDSNIIATPLFVKLTLDSQIISHGYIAFNRPFAVEKLIPGKYKLEIHQIGKRSAFFDSLMILDGQTKQLTTIYPGHANLFILRVTSLNVRSAIPTI